MLFPAALLPKPRIAAAPVAMAFDSILAGPFGSGREVALSNRETFLFDLTVGWSRACWNAWRVLRKFHSKLRGRYGVMTFEIPFGAGFLADERLGYEDVYVGVGDDVTVTFDLPIINLPDTIDTDHFDLQTNKVSLLPADYTLSMNTLATPTDLTTWTADGAPAPAFTPGQVDPATPPGTDATLVEFTDFTVPQGIYKAGNAVLYGDTVMVDVWLRAVTGTLPITVWAQTDIGDSVAKVVTLTTDWQNVAEQVTATANGNKVIRVGFTGDQTPADYLLYNARIRPGRDGRAQVTYDTAPVDGGLLTVSGRFCPAIWARFGSDVLTWTPAVGYTVDIETAIHEVRIP